VISIWSGTTSFEAVPVFSIYGCLRSDCGGWFWPNALQLVSKAIDSIVVCRIDLILEQLVANFVKYFMQTYPIS
jgi:hypothetical protein